MKNDVLYKIKSVILGHAVGDALYGCDSIPREWLDTLMRREYIEDMCKRMWEGI